MTKHTHIDDIERYIRDRKLADIYDVSRATIWRWAANGTLPPPIKIGPGVARWLMSDIRKHMQEKRHEG